MLYINIFNLIITSFAVIGATLVKSLLNCLVIGELLEATSKYKHNLCIYMLLTACIYTIGDKNTSGYVIIDNCAEYFAT